MSARRDGISREAGALLLEIIEQREPILSSLALEEHFPGAGQYLVNRRLLQLWDSKCAFVKSDATDDKLVSVLPTPGGDGFGYSSEISGWVEVRLQSLQRYRVDLPAAIAAIAGSLAWRPKMAPMPLIGEDVWDLGAARALRRESLTGIWFARRLWEKPIQQALADQAQRRPSPTLRVILTSTPADRLQGFTIAGHMILSVEDVAAADDGLAVDPGVFSARMQGTTPPPSREAVHLSDDGRTLFINGTHVLSVHSSIHVAIVRRLVEAHRENRGCTTGELLAGAESMSKSLGQALGPKWKLLRRHLLRDQNHWRFSV